MTFKEYLNDTRQLKIRLEALELELAEVRDRAIGQGSPSLEKLNIMTSLPADPMAEAIIEYADLLDRYHELKRRYNVRKYISIRYLKKYSVDKLSYKLTLDRYFNDKSFGQIAKENKIDYRKAQSIVRWNVKQVSKKIYL